MSTQPESSCRLAGTARLDPRTLAVLSAAVVAVLGPRARLRRVVRYRRDPASFWVAQGRLALSSLRNAWKPPS
jgi:hypothetical protein